MVRGDTEKITWWMEDVNDAIIPLQAGDTVHFKLWADGDTEEPLMAKAITAFTVDGKAEIILDPADTETIEPSDQYKYTIYVVYADQDEQTPVPRWPFVLKRR